MIDKNNGDLIINDSLKFYPGFTFEEFKMTKFYKEQDEVRVIYLDEKQLIGGKEYLVNFFFVNQKIYIVSLINCDEEISEEEEPKRKLLHDEILNKNCIESGTQYTWGKVVSEYDSRSNVSSINVFYNN